MRNTAKIVGTSALLILLTGCFQAQLNGPVSGARITVTDLRDGSVVHAQVVANSQASLLAVHGQEIWDSLGRIRKLWLLGVFTLDLEELEKLGKLGDHRLYLVTANGGEDTDVDRDGAEDSSYTPVQGQWHAIMTGAQLKSVGPKVSPLTEAVYQWLSADLTALSDMQVLHNLDLAAARLLTDVDRDDVVAGSDLLAWSRLFDTGKLRADLTTLNLITQTVVNGNAEADRLAWSRELVGLPVSHDSPAGSAVEQLAEQLRGLVLDDFFSVSYQALLLRSPEDVIQLGLAGRYGLDSVGLNDVSDSFAHETYDLAEVILAGLQDFDRDSLSAADQLSYDVYRWYLEDMLEGEQYLLYSYPASSFITGIPNATQFFFTDIHPLETEQDARDYLTRLQLVDNKFEQLRDSVAARAAAGIVEPAITMGWGIDSLRQVSRTRATSTDYYRHFNTALSDITELSEEQREELRAAAKAAIDDEIQPAYDALISDLEALLPQAPQAIGFDQFEGGADYYAYALRHRTTTELTAAEIHQQGLDELERVHAEIRAATAALGYSSALGLPDLYSQVAVDGGFISGGDILETYEGILDLAYQNLPQAFDILPQQELVVIGDTTGGFYVGGSEDGSRPGAFYAANVGQEAYFIMPSLAYHEGVPGHHLQIALATEQDLPDFRRYTHYTAFVEGWALYAERLAYELEWYTTDPYGNLGRLQFEAIRATRLAVDTGIHELGWSWDQAVSFYQSNTGSSLGSAQGNVARFMRWPAQATCYMIGMNKLLELRAQMMRQRGVDYDIREFHNLVLTGAALPLDILEQVVEREADN